MSEPVRNPENGEIHSRIAQLIARAETAEAALTQAQQERELFHNQLKTSLGLPDDGRIWMGTGLPTRAETLVTREKQRDALMEAVEPFATVDEWTREDRRRAARVYEQVKEKI